MKRIAALLVMLSLSLCLATNVAFGATNTESKELQNLDKAYNLKTVTSVPEGITPIKYNSVAEAEKALKKIKSDVDQQNKLAKSSSSAAKSANLAPALAIASTTTTTGSSSQVGSGYISICKMNIKAWYNWKKVGTAPKTFTSCTQIQSYLTGVTLGYEWNQKYSSSYVYGSGKYLHAEVEGTLDHYLLINGLIKVYTTYPTYHYEFSNP